MKIVLLSGGSGKRLWPLSNGDRSKQFLKVLPGGQSMVQRVWGQLAEAGLAGQAYISTGASQVEILQAQIGAEVPLIVEPSRRDTFPAIALAAAYLADVAGADEGETMVVLPVDPFVEASFFERLADLDALVQGGEVGLGLLGAAPVVPSEKYGYIVPTEEKIALGDVPGNEAGSSVEARRVSRFVEKPKEALAREMIGAGALWNCGVFALKVGYVLDVVRAAGLPVGYAALRAQYGELEKTSFDYAVVEKESRIAVIPYDGYWKDLGTWNTLTEEMAAPILGPGLLDSNRANVHIVNELDLPIAVLGLSNVVVAASPDGILVSDKEASPRVKDFITFEDEPRYEERAWGTVHVLDRQTFANGFGVVTQKLHVHKGATMSSAGDERRVEVWTITRGAGEMRVGNKMQQISLGSVIAIDSGERYELSVIEELELIAVIRYI